MGQKEVIYEQALHFEGRAKRASRERASDWRSREQRSSNFFPHPWHLRLLTSQIT